MLWILLPFQNINFSFVETTRPFHNSGFPLYWTMTAYFCLSIVNVLYFVFRNIENNFPFVWAGFRIFSQLPQHRIGEFIFYFSPRMFISKRAVSFNFFFMILVFDVGHHSTVYKSYKAKTFFSPFVFSFPNKEVYFFTKKNWNISCGHSIFRVLC